ncbi:MAG: HD domain-containing protein [Candidatus Zixiibacteriota bacterium]
MLSGNIILLLYRAANMKRWNDHIRPPGFTELEKQAQKMTIAYTMGHLEEQQIDWIYLIKRGFYEFLQRVIVTDINPRIYNRIKSENPVQLRNFVIERLVEENVDKRIIDEMQDTLYPDTITESESFVKKLLEAASVLATWWEFKIIYDFNRQLSGIDKTLEKIEMRLEDHYSLIGVQKILLKKKSYRFIDICGQLRHQIRWAQTNRVPETTVLGHSIIVAYMAYLGTRDFTDNPNQVYNNFFCGLFHDLPEVMTGDVISPVKNRIEGLSDVLREIEISDIQEHILPLLPKSLARDLRFFLIDDGDEFTNKVRQQSSEKDDDMLDGQFLELCDKFAAYIEAKLSIYYGLRSIELEQGIKRMSDKYREREYNLFAFDKLFDEIDKKLSIDKEL